MRTLTVTSVNDHGLLRIIWYIQAMVATISKVPDLRLKFFIKQSFFGLKSVQLTSPRAIAALGTSSSGKTFSKYHLNDLQLRSFRNWTLSEMFP